VLFLDAEGRYVGAAAVSLAEPRFLAVDDERLYVLDCDNSRRLTTLDWTGATLCTTSLPRFTDVVTGLFATAEGPCVEVAHASVFLVAAALRASAELDSDIDESLGDLDSSVSLRSILGRPAGYDLDRATQVTFAPGETVNVRLSTIDPISLNATATVEFTPVVAAGLTIEHLVSVDTSNSGALLIGARLLDGLSTATGQASLAITRLDLSADGSVVDEAVDPNGTSTLYLSDSPFAYIGQPYSVSPDGRVFQPVGSDAGYSIVVYAFPDQEVQP
jgi:hypothetical protein